MIYKYTGTQKECAIEVDEFFYEILSDLDKDEFNSERKHKRRYPMSLENIDYEGEWLADDTDLLHSLIQKEQYKLLYAALENLSEAQKKLVIQIYFHEISASDIARKEGVGKSAISHRLNRIHKRLQNILK